MKKKDYYELSNIELAQLGLNGDIKAKGILIYEFFFLSLNKALRSKKFKGYYFELNDKLNYNEDEYVSEFIDYLNEKKFKSIYSIINYIQEKNLGNLSKEEFIIHFEKMLYRGQTFKNILLDFKKLQLKDLKIIDSLIEESNNIDDAEKKTLSNLKEKREEYEDVIPRPDTEKQINFKEKVYQEWINECKKDDIKIVLLLKKWHNVEIEDFSCIKNLPKNFKTNFKVFKEEKEEFFNLSNCEKETLIFKRFALIEETLKEIEVFNTKNEYSEILKNKNLGIELENLESELEKRRHFLEELNKKTVSINVTETEIRKLFNFEAVSESRNLLKRTNTFIIKCIKQ